MDFNTRELSDAQEKRVSKLFNAKINPNSGAVRNSNKKGDLENETHRFECKATMGESLSIKKNDVRKIEKLARQKIKKWIMNFEFQGDNPGDVIYNLTLVPTDDFLELLEYYKK